jgi:diguanylate cyclase (GGDEF)-like protein/PAS domain S-box-containing protein
MIQKPNRQQLLEIYRWSIVASAGVIVAVSVYQVFKQSLDWQFIALLVFTSLIASQISIKIPRFNGTITVSDTFIFIALLVWGESAAVITAVIESIASTSKVSRRYQTYFFNIAVSAITIWTTSQVVSAFSGESAGLAAHVSNSSFALAMCVMGLTYYAVSMILIAAMQAFKLSFTSWKDWALQLCLWSCVTFFVAAAAAGLAVKLIGNFSLFSIAVVSPIIALVYFTYRTYLKNLDALQESEARFRSSFDYATVGVALVSATGKWLQVNQSLRDLLGRSDVQLLTTNYQAVIHPDDLPALETKIEALVVGAFPAFQIEVRLSKPDNTEVWTLLSASSALDAQNAVKYLIFQIQDIKLRKDAEEKLRYDASHDALTGLPNRAAYTNKLEHALQRNRQQYEKLIAVLFLDLDGFKLVNDSLGHAAGDELLKETAARLLECVRGRDAVARLGGDEFTILLEDLPNVDKAVQIAERVRQRLTEPFLLADQEVFIGTSIGIATSQINYQNSGEILRDADAAMYQAKARGKGCYVVFDQEMYASATRLLRLASDLRRAAERGEIAVHYQVIQSLDTNEICGFEALVRWNHPLYGVLMPSDFIPLAEENGLIGQIDSWTLTEACRQMRAWQNSNQLCSDFKISVNVSTRQFAQTGLIENVRRVLDETGLHPENLQLEITESAMAKNLKNTAHVLNELNRIGVTIALDDFGTGYSSLSYLHEFPISILKIDRSFVSRMSKEPDGAEIVRAIVALARSLQMKVIAEGIETAEQLEALRDIGCGFGQGYLFSHPVVSDEATKLFDNTNFQSAAQRSLLQRKNLRLVSNG